MRSVFLGLAALLALSAPALAEQEIIGAKDGKDIVTVRNVAGTGSKQDVTIFSGISEETAGAKGLSLTRVVIPPGAAARAHVHKGYESAIYLIKGRVEIRYGEGLRKSVLNRTGDFVYIPADVPHQPRNLSSTEEAVAIVARTDPNEQESVVPYPEK